MSLDECPCHICRTLWEIMVSFDDARIRWTPTHWQLWVDGELAAELERLDGGGAMELRRMAARYATETTGKRLMERDDDGNN